MIFLYLSNALGSMLWALEKHGQTWIALGFVAHTDGDTFGIWVEPVWSKPCTALNQVNTDSLGYVLNIL